MLMEKNRNLPILSFDNLAPAGLGELELRFRRLRFATPPVMHISPLRGYFVSLSAIASR
ncbi:MAG: hypothetical protein LBK06_07035 [Planctomycetaceae bacterium]|nr:hypothetical protein [Planctomycetaceae bacterium]